MGGDGGLAFRVLLCRRAEATCAVVFYSALVRIARSQPAIAGTRRRAPADRILTCEEVAENRRVAERANCGFEKVELLAGNVEATIDFYREPGGSLNSSVDSTAFVVVRAPLPHLP